MLLHRLGVALALNAQDRAGRIRAGGAAPTLPVAPPEGDRADRAHQVAFLRPAVFLLASARADTERRPFFSAASMRRVTASPSTSLCSFRPFSTTAPSQVSKTLPSGA